MISGPVSVSRRCRSTAAVAVRSTIDIGHYVTADVYLQVFDRDAYIVVAIHLGVLEHP